ncbi:DUF1330 domain-containing protein [Zavarzinia sp. CC-PAN008]|uniref:DUF1330 domain-containing protein n=1 Tax=Zavarzinia sp. CC-PAN008 TaxID=3243332 RepID=UPI003F744CCD
MSAYVVFIKDRVRDAEEFATYGKKAGASMAGHTVKPLSVYGKCETLEGPPIEGSVIVEFPSIEAAKAWYNSPAYTDARKHRFLGADYRVFITEGL